MFQPDDPSAVATRPTPAAAGTPGWFGPGDPAVGTLPTLLQADFMNGVLAELLAILAAAGVTPDKAQTTQILAAIRIISQQVGDARYLLVAGNTYVTQQQLSTAVAAGIASVVGGAPAAWDTLGELVTRFNSDESQQAALLSALAAKAATTYVDAQDLYYLGQAQGFANGAAGSALSQANATASAGDAATLAAAIAATGGYDVLCDDRPAGKGIYHYILQWTPAKYSEVLVINSGLHYPYQNNNAASQVNYYLYAGGSINQVRICGMDTTYNVKQLAIHAANTTNPLIHLVSYAGNSGGFNTIENNYVPGYPTYGGANQYEFPGALSGFACDIDIQANPGATFDHGRLLVLGKRAS